MVYSINPYFVALGGRRKFNFPPPKDLTGLFQACWNARDRESMQLAWKKLQDEFGIKLPRQKLERDVEIALFLLSNHKQLSKLPNRKHTIREIFDMVHQWDKTYTKMGVRTVIQRRKLGFLISPSAPVGRPRKKY